jgi:hypothetical protein
MFKQLLILSLLCFISSTPTTQEETDLSFSILEPLKCIIKSEVIKQDVKELFTLFLEQDYIQLFTKAVQFFPEIKTEVSKCFTEAIQLTYGIAENIEYRKCLFFFPISFCQKYLDIEDLYPYY